VRRPLAVAITGSIAAGKSEALAAFARHGAVTRSSDEIVHRLLADEPAVRDAIAARWGEEALRDRARIAEVVFRDPAELEWLERLIHPHVRRIVAEWLAELRAQPEPPALAVVEIPLLYETGGEERVDAVVAITAPQEVRERRRQGFSEREARLLPDEEKAQRADFAYVNDASLGALDAFVAGVVEKLSSS
jgi:dephospho-CoA kinase